MEPGLSSDEISVLFVVAVASDAVSAVLAASGVVGSSVAAHLEVLGPWSHSSR